MLKKYIVSSILFLGIAGVSFAQVMLTEPEVLITSNRNSDEGWKLGQRVYISAISQRVTVNDSNPFLFFLVSGSKKIEVCKSVARDATCSFVVTQDIIDAFKDISGPLRVHACPKSLCGTSVEDISKTSVYLEKQSSIFGGKLSRLHGNDFVFTTNDGKTVQIPCHYRAEDILMKLLSEGYINQNQQSDTSTLQTVKSLVTSSDGNISGSSAFQTLETYYSGSKAYCTKPEWVQYANTSGPSNTTANVSGSQSTSGTTGGAITNPNTTTPAFTDTSKFVLQVIQQNILVRGYVEKVQGDEVYVRSHGGVWKVKLTSFTEYVSQNKTRPAVRVGDYIGARGRLYLNEDFTFNADAFRNRTLNP
jgi:hypothetical protein